MTLQEKKAKLEDDVKQLVTAFHDDTGLTATDFKIETDFALMVDLMAEPTPVSTWGFHCTVTAEVKL